MRSAFTLSWAALFLAAATAAAAPVNPELAQVRHIYLLPMSNGLDQYLANRLTQTGRFQVVTDPQLADAIFTDRIGTAFEERFAELFPPPPPPANTRKDDEKNDEEDASASTTAALIEADSRRPVSNNFGRARGNVYLIDRASRKVIWSEYRRPRNTQPDQLDELAEYLANRLRKHAGTMPPPSPASPPAKPDTAPPAAK